LFTFFIFSRKERLIGMVDGMTQKEIFGEIKRKEILMFKVKENWLVWLMTSRKGKIRKDQVRKESFCD
jgi:hypothetical protein